MAWKAADAEADSDWRALPDELDTCDGAQTARRLVALPTNAALDAGEVNVKRRPGCTDCPGIDRVDACLIFTWEQSGAGAAEWMAAQGFPGNAGLSRQCRAFQVTPGWSAIRR